MKFPKYLAGLALLGAMTLALSSCFLFSFNSPPEVTLSSSYYAIYSDEDVVLTADATDADNDPLTYAWYFDGVLEPTLTSSSISAYWLTSSYIARTVSVTVSDGTNEVSDSVDIGITGAASIRVLNNTGVAINSIQYRVNDGLGTGTYAEAISSGTLASGYLFTLYGITDDTSNYDVKASDGTSIWDSYVVQTSGIDVISGYYTNVNLGLTTVTISSPSSTSSRSGMVLVNVPAIPKAQGVGILKSQIRKIPAQAESADAHDAKAVYAFNL